MFYTIKTASNKPVSIIKLKTLVRARSFISLYPTRGTELILNNYLVENYKLTLKNACLLLLANLQFSEGEENEIIFFFKEEKYDKLARIITYGIDNISGISTQTEERSLAEAHSSSSIIRSTEARTRIRPGMKPISCNTGP